MILNFLLETMHIRRQYTNNFKLLKEKKKTTCKSRIICPAKTSLIWRLQTEKLKEFITTELTTRNVKESPSGRQNDPIWKSRSTQRN